MRADMSEGHEANGGQCEEEKTPMNHVEDGDGGHAAEEHDTVGLRQFGGMRGKRRGCYLSRIQGFIITLVVLVVVILLAAVAALLGSRRCPCEHLNASTSLPVYGVATPRPTLNPALPWADLRLPRSLIPSFYRLELKVDLDHFTFSGSVDIDFECKDETTYVIVHVNDLAINQEDITLREKATGRAVRIKRHVSVPLNQFHVVETRQELQRAVHYTITFSHFVGNISDDLKGLYRSMYRQANGTTRYLAASQLQSIDARKVFPCFDEPDLKANFSVSLIHKPEYTALSNMPVIRNETLDDGWVKEVYDVTPVMSTYLLAFVVADFKAREKTTESGLLIRVWSQPDMTGQTRHALDFAEKSYRFFADYFGMPEVVPKADHVAVPDFSAGAMENWGLVLYRETSLLYDDDSSAISNKHYVSLVIAHEVAHTWFGNMVTMRWWDDLWLNEGFANTLMYFALDNIYPDWNVFDMQLVINVYPVMTKDSLVTSHAISTPIVHPDEIAQFFDSISYDKGMSVLRLLRGFLGWQNFQKGLRMYVETFKYANAEMSELWGTFEKATEGTAEIAQIMDTWTRQMGFPVVKFVKISSTRYRLEQRRFLINPDAEYDANESIYGYKWRIPFIYKIQGRDEEVTVWMNMSSAYIDIPPNAWVIGNLDYMGFFRTNYDLDMWIKLTEQLQRDHTVFSAANRAGLINDVFNLARANQLSYEVALNLTAYLDREQDYVPWKAFLDSIEFLHGMLATSSSYGKLQSYVYQKVKPLYDRIAKRRSTSLLDINLRKAIVEAACNVGVKQAVKMATDTFNGWKEYGSRIDRDLAAVFYSVGIRQGGEAEWDHLWEEAHKTKVPSEAESMMSALAFTQQPWLLWRYARWSLDSNKVRMQDVRNLFSYFAATPLGRSVSLQFLLTNWDTINERFGMDSFLLRDIIHATTSMINTDYEYNQLRRLYSERAPAGVAVKAANNSLALIRSNIKWMNLHHDTISSWLDRYVQPQQ